MSNDKKEMGDEYQFPQEEYIAAEHESEYEAADDSEANHSEVQSDAYQQSAPAPSFIERFPFLKNKRVLMVGGLVIAVVIAFQVMKPSSPSEPTVQQPTAAQRAAAERQAQQSALMNKINNISQDANNALDAQQQLQSQVGTLQAALDKSNAQNEAMRQAMLQLAQQVQSLSDEMKKTAPQAKVVKKAIPSPVITYHLRAVLPGRAWIEGSDGSANSVTVGTHLKNYGVVQSIDADGGRVLTSSGKVITYNSDGN